MDGRLILNLRANERISLLDKAHFIKKIFTFHIIVTTRKFPRKLQYCDSLLK